CISIEKAGPRVALVATAVRIGISQYTGDPRYDGAASILIGLILAFIAYFLAYESKALLIGEAADPELVTAMHQMVESKSGVTSVGEILTVQRAPDQITA